MNKFDHREILITLSNPNWQTEMNFQAMNAQARHMKLNSVLMNGRDQFSQQEDRDAAEALKMQIDFETLHGNPRLLKIYQDALAELEARYV